MMPGSWLVIGTFAEHDSGSTSPGVTPSAAAVVSCTFRGRHPPDLLEAGAPVVQGLRTMEWSFR
jgi:hypothetical protein